MEKEKILNFLYQSINDIQGTIRAVDIKLGFVFALTFAPLVGIPEIIKIYSNLFKNDGFGIINFIATLSAISWALSAFILFNAVAAISDPRKYIKSSTQSGCFYGGGRFPITWKDTLCNTPVESKYTIEEEIKILPKSEEFLIKELMFEKLKLSYIRDIKIKRCHYCLELTFTWIVLGGICWINSLLS